MPFEGRVHRFGDDINTDLIIPARYLITTDPKELAMHCMEDDDPQFTKKVAAGDVMVAGKNFGCGSSREHAPISIKAAGISVVIAKSFARIFLRNSINIGLPIMECPEAVEALSAGAKVRVDIGKGTVETEDGRKFQARPFPPFMMEIIRAGGLLNHVKIRMGGNRGK
jgi:3-isopropylmalate/(R)-2-methylmalate dehydratase small subunit